jgi:hypothetical protein
MFLSGANSWRLLCGGLLARLARPDRLAATPCSPAKLECGNRFVIDGHVQDDGGDARRFK